MGSELAKIESFRYQLAVAETIEEIQVIKDAASAYAEFAKKQKIGTDRQNEVGRFRIDIETKLGKWLEVNFDHGGNHGNQYTSGKLTLGKLAKMPLNPKYSKIARDIANEPPEEKEKIITSIIQSGEVVTPNNVFNKIRDNKKKQDVKAKEAQYKEEISEVTDFDVDIFTTDRKFQIIYADPAWSYWEGGQKNQSLHYSTMTIDDIKNLPVNRITDDNCILFIWVTFPILKEAFNVIESWGFKYSTCGFNWVKKNKNADSYFFGNGSWTRANSELCLIATKGSITRIDASISQVLDDPIMEHSRKPERVRNLIVKLVGELPRIELFSRNQNNDGWFNWGNKI